MPTISGAGVESREHPKGVILEQDNELKRNLRILCQTVQHIKEELFGIEPKGEESEKRPMPQGFFEEMKFRMTDNHILVKEIQGLASYVLSNITDDKAPIPKS